MTGPHLLPFLVSLALALAVMSAAWLLSLRLKDAGVADIFWGPTLVLKGWAAALFPPAIGLAAGVTLALATLWGLRLGVHLFHRRSGKEDHRYTRIRNRFGRRFPLFSLFVIFWLQALLLWIVSWPLQAAIAAGRVSALALAGWLLVLAGTMLEALADRQLAAFRAVPGNDGRVLDTGLWRWSRHPNYFGDFLVWWGFFLAGSAAGTPWWSIASPLLMSLLLLHVSGVGLMEETIVDRRPGYKDYAARTSAFFPWPPAR